MKASTCKAMKEARARDRYNKGKLELRSDADAGGQRRCLMKEVRDHGFRHSRHSGISKGFLKSSGGATDTPSRACSWSLCSRSSACVGTGGGTASF